MRIAIVDDISEERTLLHNRLESQFSRRNVHTDILEYENGEAFLTTAKECHNFHRPCIRGISGPDSAPSCKTLYCKPILNFKLTFYTFIC